MTLCFTIKSQHAAQCLVPKVVSTVPAPCETRAEFRKNAGECIPRHKIKMLSDMSGRPPRNLGNQNSVVYKCKSWNSLAAQWLGLMLALQGAQVRSLVEEQPSHKGHAVGPQGFRWTPKPPPHTHRHPRVHTQTLQGLCQTAHCPHEDTQLCINSSNFYLEGKTVKTMDRLFLQLLHWSGDMNITR